MRKNNFIIASECQSIADGATAIQPTREHFLYLLHLVVGSRETADQFTRDVVRGDEQAENFYSQQFADATGLKTK